MDDFPNGGGVKKRVYVESSVISYLTARDSTNVLKLAKQITTRKWWKIRSRFDLYISSVVMDEIKDGDAEAARLRVEAVAGIKILQRTPDAVGLAREMIVCNAVPLKSVDDAAHIAIAAVYGMDLIVTWNHTHISNQNTLEKIREVVKRFGFTAPLLVNPMFILEGRHED